ncbi:MAG: hypothetical protein NXH90_05080 [Flavobacteriaceae bacterium]|nr:hypothetical protein [Flavobacteriaceae bacterium]
MHADLFDVLLDMRQSEKYLETGMHCQVKGSLFCGQPIWIHGLPCNLNPNLAHCSKLVLELGNGRVSVVDG